MADFTRFISYFYDYKNGERNRNLGFAKVESRQGMCRVGVNLNHGQVLGQNMVLYGYVCEPDGVYLVSLGEMERGTRERRWNFPMERLNSKGTGLERLSGLILLSENRETYLLSVWNDGPRTADEIRQGRFWEEKSSLEDGSLSEREASLEADLFLKVEACPETESFLKAGSSLEAESFGKAESSLETESFLRADSAPETDSSRENNFSFKNESVNRQNDREPVQESPDDNHTRYQIDAENDRIAMNAAVPEGWRKLCKLFPAARPFEPSAWEVLCISLQDIGRLPPENWVWGSNHFLLHGFYQYHHLILARQRNENRIYLGVPGEFGMNEKFMAAMFGLHQFQRERQGKSDKGYWLTPIRL